jgi:hypothetical protein
MRYTTLGEVYGPKQTTAPTVPQGQSWTNYQTTGNAARSGTVSALPGGAINSYITGKQTPLYSTIVLDSESLSSTKISTGFISKISETSTTPEVPKTDFLKTYLPYIAIGGVGLVTMLALKG